MTEGGSPWVRAGKEGEGPEGSEGGHLEGGLGISGGAGQARAVALQRLLQLHLQLRHLLLSVPQPRAPCQALTVWGCGELITTSSTPLIPKTRLPQIPAGREGGGGPFQGLPPSMPHHPTFRLQASRQLAPAVPLQPNPQRYLQAAYLDNRRLVPLPRNPSSPRSSPPASRLLPRLCIRSRRRWALLIHPRPRLRAGGGRSGGGRRGLGVGRAGGLEGVVQHVRFDLPPAATACEEGRPRHKECQSILYGGHADSGQAQRGASCASRAQKGVE